MSRSARTPSAADWVRTLPRGARVDWDELEAHVLRDHPEALRALGPAGEGVRVGRRGIRVALAAGIAIAALVALPVVAAPVWGLAALVGDPFGIRDVDGAVALPIAGLSLLVAGAVQVVLLVRALGGRPDTGGIGAITSILAALIAVGTGLVGSRQDVPGWQAWFAVAVVVALLGGLVEATGRRSARRPVGTDAAARPGADALASGRADRTGRAGRAGRTVARPATDAGRPSEQLERERRLDAALDRIGDDERTRLLDDRRRALEWLRLHGSISPDEAARAIRSPLGRLSASA
ncbi:hypothetical protein [Agromyces sp. GXS1127]|uniref:hypothetical protein n=1 Tax=Agromyces sp. GXS1127 TaxID=3424181 RepID=UPI003D323FD2